MTALTRETCTIDVEYRGNTTISHLTADFEGREFLPISNRTVPIAIHGIFPITVEFPVSLEPARPQQSGEIFKRTETIVREIKELGMRGLNIPETLEMGRRFPQDRFVCLGYEIESRFGSQVLYVLQGAAGLLPWSSAWVPAWNVPATRQPDPLA